MLRIFLKKSCLIAILFLILCSQKGRSQKHVGWQLQPVGLQTRWAKEVNPDHPLPDYPRPQMVRKNNWQNLNGLWNYAITVKDAPKPTSFQGQILVPYPIESALSGVKRTLQPSENLWYQRFFKANIKNNQKTLLHFGAVDWQATVYINGKEIGTHSGGYTEFSFDITSALKSGSNEIIIKVFDPTDQGIGPHGKQVLNPGNIYYTPSSGIWQTVWLENVASDYIDKLILTPNIDKGILNVKVEAPADCNVELVASSLGKLVSRAEGKAGDIINLPMKDAKLWSPSSPFLYDLQVNLLKNGRTLDQVKSYFGMRKVSITKDRNGIDRIFLNNQYYYNLGTLDQGFWPDGLYTAPTDSALCFDIRAIKSMGFNTIRKHIKVEPARWYYYTDKLGILVWQDLVNPNPSLPEGSKQEFERESAEILSQLHNYPSITTWVLFNEKWGQYDQERLTKWVKQVDPSRLVNGHSGEYLYVNGRLRSPSPNAYISADMTDVHAYPNPMISEKQEGKAQVLGEFGGIAAPIRGHLWNDLEDGWGYNGLLTPIAMSKQYKEMVDSLKALEERGLSASIYTQPFDVESEQNGLITYDRNIIKLNIDTIRIINKKLAPSTERLDSTYTQFRIDTVQVDTLFFGVQKNKYLAGNNDSALLRGLSLMALKAYDTSLLNKVINSIMATYVDPLSADNIKLIYKLVISKENKGFLLITEHSTKVNEFLGKDAAEGKITQIITETEIDPILRKSNTINWQELENLLSNKYNNFGLEAVLQARVLHSINTHQWQYLKDVLSIWFNTFGSKRKWIGPVLINNLAWSIFQNVSDLKTLEAAAEMTEYYLSSNVPQLIDTHANLKYKLGKTQEALHWEQLAHARAPQDIGIAENLNKMKKGVKTW